MTQVPHGELTGVTSIDPGDARYDAYVEGHEGALAYHTGAWARVLQRTYGFRPAYLALERNGSLAGVLPLMLTRGLVSGKRVRSLPAVPQAGPLGNSRADEVALIEAACRLTEERGAHLLTLLSRSAGFEDSVPGLRANPTHPTWITPLQADADELRRGWKKRSNNLYRSIAKAEATGVTVREGDGDDDLRAFYRLYLDTMKRHRSLPRPLRQIALDRRLLGPKGVTRLFVAEHGGEIVAGGLFHALNGMVELLYNGSDPARRELRTNFALYWHVIRWAAESGYRAFDWGAAEEGTTLARFKAQWSAEPVPEFRYEYAVGSGAAAERLNRIRNTHDVLDRGARNRREELVEAAWERAPLTLTRVAGTVAYRLF